jgi:hypothetical protein
MTHHLDVPPTVYRPVPPRRRIPLALRWWFLCACVTDRLVVAVACLRREPRP